MNNLESNWLNILSEEINKQYFKDISEYLKQEQDEGKIIYPPTDKIFNALNHTPFDDIKVVIIGQDPYHGVGQAHGLSFSVPNGIIPPPSLKNIFKEINKDLGININTNNGNLEKWTKQGVLLLNSVLTVEASKPASHSKIGWQTFTDNIIKTISSKREGIIFILWGNYAKNKKDIIDTEKHYILEASHPSPFSAYKGYFGCRHFSQVNEILKRTGKEEIDWSL